MFCRAVLVGFVLLASVTFAAAGPAILVLGDSWAAGIVGFKAFEQVLAKHGISGVTILGEETALGGSRADQWAENHQGKLDTLRRVLEEHPEIAIVHISIGGNDFLRAAMEDGVATAAPEARHQVWERIWNDIETLMAAICAGRPDARILLNDYDYLDPQLMKETFQLKFPDDATAENVNAALLELAEYKRSQVEATGLCDYLQHFGLLQYHYGFPPHFEKHAVPLPGGPPDFAPFAGGRPGLPNSPEAMPDGVHPMPEGYVAIIDRCFETFYRAWLESMPAEAAAAG